MRDSVTPPALGREPLATLYTWADQVWTSLLDRDGSWGGRLSDDGTFQRFNADEDDEYQLDLLTGLFSPSEDARWALHAMGLRAAAASIDHPHVVQTLEWRERFPVASGWALEGRYLRERTLSAERDHVQPGLFWKPLPEGPWEVGATIGLHFFKASADVELVAGRAWLGPEGTRGRVELRVAALDAFNDLVFQGLGVAPEDAEAHFDYRVRPFAVRGDGVWNAGPMRFEVRAGVSRGSRVRVTFPATGDPPYELSERVAFVGGLLEAHAGSATTASTHVTFARADTDRLADTASAVDLSLEEVTWQSGARLRRHVAADLSLEADVLWRLRPEERRIGWRLPLVAAAKRHDREWFGAVALVRRPMTGWTGRVLVATVDRQADPDPLLLTAGNQRLVLDGGFRFATGFEVTAGTRWDLDGFSRRAFDGAQLRITSGNR